MRVVLDGSWALLAPREREAMEALSVFRGGFAHAAAREVAGVPLPVLSSLVDKGFLKVDETGRFGMHPLVAADASARTQRDQVMLTACLTRHAEYFARHLAGLLIGPPGEVRQTVSGVDVDLANAHRAWAHAIAMGRHDLTRSMHSAWRSYYVATGKYEQSVRHFDAALATDAPPPLLAELRATTAYFLIRHRQPERAMALATQSLSVAESLGDVALVQDCVGTIAACKQVLGQWREARTWVERSLQMARDNRAQREMATDLSNLGLITTLLGDFDEAVGHYDRAIAIQRELGNSVNVARALCNRGFVYVARADWLQAKESLGNALRYAIDHGVHVIALEAEFLLGTVQVELNSLDVAERHLKKSREGFNANKNAGFLLKVDYYLARIAARRGLHEGAAKQLLAAVRTARERDWHYDQLYAMLFVAELLRDQRFASGSGPDLAQRSISAACTRVCPHACRRVLEDARADGAGEPRGVRGDRGHLGRQ